MKSKNDILSRAVELAVQYHKGQYDKSGEPYILHCFRVMLKGKTVEEMITGVLHDIVEDTIVDEEMLRREGFDEEILFAVKALTKIESESNDAYLERVMSSRLASRVKLNDLEDNMNLMRLKEISPKDTERLNKYVNSYRRITQSLY